jgi:hypothetical protein
VVQPEASAEGATPGETAGGFARAVTSGHLPGGERFEGGIPGAPPVRNKTGRASKGVSRREGSQTLRTERSGLGRPAGGGPSSPDVL